MVKIYWKTKCLSKLDKNKVRNFIKSYEVDDLTIIFTDNWKQRVLRGNKFVMLVPNISRTGIYYPISNGGFLYGFGGKHHIRFPCICINSKSEYWLKTFFHEFGHYIDDKTNGGLKKYQKCERFAIDFARHYGKNV